MFFRKLKQLFNKELETSQRPEAVEINLEELNEFLQKKNEERLSSIKDKAEKHLQLIQKRLKDLKSELKSLKQVEHPDEVQMLEDVKDNFCREKLRLVKGLSIPQAIDQRSLTQIEQEISQTLSQISQLSNKEQFALDKFEESSLVWDELQELKQEHQSLQNFIWDEYDLQTSLDEVKEKLDYIGELKSNNQSLKKEIKRLKGEKEEQESKVEQAIADYQQYQQDERQEEIKAIKEDKEALKRKQAKTEKQVERNLAKVDRALRKFKYKVDNEGVKLSRSGRQALNKLLADKNVVDKIASLDNQEQGLRDLFDSMVQKAEELGISDKKKEGLSQLVSNLSQRLIDPIEARKDIEKKLKELEKDLEEYEEFMSEDKSHQKRINRLKNEKGRIEDKIASKRVKIKANESKLSEQKEKIVSKIKRSQLRPDRIKLEETE